MEASILHSSFLQGHQFSSKLLRRKMACGATSHRRRCIMISSSRGDAYDRDSNGKLVDQNMIVLRQRIQEMEMTEKKYEAPSEWMEWERQYYVKSYSSDICEAVGLLQSLLMKTRPSLALGMVALVLLSVTTSGVVILSHLVEMAKWLGGGIPLS